VTRTQKQFFKNFQCDFSKNMNGTKSIFSKIKIFLKPLQFEKHIEKIHIQILATIYLNFCLLRLSWVVELRKSREAGCLF